MGSTATTPRAWATRIIERAMPKRMVDVLQSSIAVCTVMTPKSDHCRPPVAAVDGAHARAKERTLSDSTWLRSPSRKTPVRLCSQ